MADLRELIILSPEVLTGGPETALQRKLADVRMLLRRAVIKLSRVPAIRPLFVWVYSAHFGLIAAIAKRFTETLAVYGGGGVVAGDLHVGISDIDIAIIGEWPESTQINLLKIFGLLTVLSPLYDRGCMVNICTLTDLHAMAETNMQLALMYARGQMHWRLLYGTDVLTTLPPIEPGRIRGAAIVDLRRWWSYMTTTTLGTGVMSRDAVFQNSVCYKVVAEMLRIEKMLAGVVIGATRNTLLEEARLWHDKDEDFYARLLLSAKDEFLDTTHDLRPETIDWLLPRMERIHLEAAKGPNLIGGPQAELDGTADERLIAPATAAHCEDVIRVAEREWGGLQGAYLVPNLTMMSVDSLALILQPKDGVIPSAELLKRVARQHLSTDSALPQKLRLYVLLTSAYTIGVGGDLDIYQYTLSPSTAPEVFASLASPGFALRGEQHMEVDDLRWTPFADEVMMEQLVAHRGAYKRYGLCSRPNMLQNLRNFWRYLQMLVIERTTQQGRAILPVTMPAVARVIKSWNPGLTSDVDALAGLLQRALLQAEAADPKVVEPIMRRVYEATLDNVSVQTSH